MARPQQQTSQEPESEEDSEELLQRSSTRERSDSFLLSTHRFPESNVRADTDYIAPFPPVRQDVYRADGTWIEPPIVEDDYPEELRDSYLEYELGSAAREAAAQTLLSLSQGSGGSPWTHPDNMSESESSLTEMEDNDEDVNDDGSISPGDTSGMQIPSISDTEDALRRAFPLPPLLSPLQLPAALLPSLFSPRIPPLRSPFGYADREFFMPEQNLMFDPILRGFKAIPTDPKEFAMSLLTLFVYLGKLSYLVVGKVMELRIFAKMPETLSRAYWPRGVVLQVIRAEQYALGVDMAKKIAEVLAEWEVEFETFPAIPDDEEEVAKLRSMEAVQEREDFFMEILSETSDDYSTSILKRLYDTYKDVVDLDNELTSPSLRMHREVLVCKVVDLFERCYIFVHVKPAEEYWRAMSGTSQTGTVPSTPAGRRDDSQWDWHSGSEDDPWGVDSDDEIL